MSPDDLRQMLTVCGIVLVVLGPVLLAMPIGECPSCVHCARKRTDGRDTICPLHRQPRSKCASQHEDPP